ncbi:MAG: 2-C-methyl-D-erythritol 4-phosphate cytidylyltransferase [Bacteroidetes bacterium]|nr:2-C-methyl-D-erythritol 4-phosphate cytidylyltransferase [Bacteroidota bacterium]
MQSALPKQMIQVHGKEILIHTIEKFVRFDTSIEIILVIHESLKDPCTALLKKYNLDTQTVMVAGGPTRFHSVRNGLDAIPDTHAVVGIHDAARPLVSVEAIERCYKTAQIMGNAIPVVNVNESLREVNGASNHAVSRDRYRIVQTPQCFELERIRAAFTQPYSDAFTDDATVLESTGEHIHLVEGNVENIKITHPVDLQIAALFLA